MCVDVYKPVLDWKSSNKHLFFTATSNSRLTTLVYNNITINYIFATNIIFKHSVEINIMPLWITGLGIYQVVDQGNMRQQRTVYSEYTICTTQYTNIPES